MVSSNISGWSNAGNATKEYFDISTLEAFTPSSIFTSTLSNYENISTVVSNFTMDMVNMTSEISNNNMDYFNYFVGTTLFATMFSLFGSSVNFYFAMKISRNLHKSMIKNLLEGCMHFFDTNLIGNILTRFSRDLYYLDEFIPYLWHGFRLFFVLAVSFTLIASVIPWLSCLFILMGFIFYAISDYLLSTSRNLQRLSSSTLSPMIGHLNTTLEGLITIRAHGTQQVLRDEFDKYQDVFVTANHLKEISSKVMGFYCHCIESMLTAFMTLRLLYLDDILAGDAGLVLTQATTLSHRLEWALSLLMILENSMTGVERLLEYTKIPRENTSGQELENWPEQGEIKFRDVSLTYRKKEEIVLKNLNFTIHPQEKIGVVGRTGAGKSSLIVTLFRIYDFEGHITIDDVNIKTLSLECLRTHLAIIPQDPVIFSGSLRSNIDPFEKISDEKVWNILETVNLKSHFRSLLEDITEKNLSIGQKQLISIARALTWKTKIVIMDEATANMDEAMDNFIHQKIEELFKSCTVITVAHRLNTVMNSDRIIVMNNGEIVEFDTPQNLLENNEGLFHRMVLQENSSGS
ncbi:hypothetical protein HHI36_005345 [Cryptolaemus montrouzieri]|uniref:Uncharacterized protein n=1 Tax=Cryptolaemus montrouzieri TaxID=559131 RepID=A0ABD2NU22_9CUCU